MVIWRVVYREAEEKCMVLVLVCVRYEWSRAITREAMANICQGQLDYIHSHCMVSLSLSVCPCLMLTNPMIATLDKRAVVNVWARTVSDATVSK